MPREHSLSTQADSTDVLTTIEEKQISILLSPLFNNLKIRTNCSFCACCLNVAKLRSALGSHSRKGFYYLFWHSLVQKAHFVSQFSKISCDRTSKMGFVDRKPAFSNLPTHCEWSSLSPIFLTSLVWPLNSVKPKSPQLKFIGFSSNTTQVPTILSIKETHS